jgi:hypothetical protein
LRDLAAWQARRTAVGRAYGRYLYVLGAVSLFYFFLHQQFDPMQGFEHHGLALPFTEFEVNLVVVWASGPGFIAFLVLAVLGARAAARVADRELAAAAELGPTHEAADAEPTIVDMMMYASPAWRPLHRLGPLLWAAVLTVAVGLSIHLLVSGVWSFEYLRYGWLYRAVGAFLTLVTIPRLALAWWSALRPPRRRR